MSQRDVVVYDRATAVNPLLVAAEVAGYDLEMQQLI